MNRLPTEFCYEPASICATWDNGWFPWRTEKTEGPTDYRKRVCHERHGYWLSRSAKGHDPAKWRLASPTECYERPNRREIDREPANTRTKVLAKLCQTARPRRLKIERDASSAFRALENKVPVGQYLRSIRATFPRENYWFMYEPFHTRFLFERV